MFRAFVLTAGLFSMLPPPAASCDLALALAVDVSGSIDSHEFRTQMDGLATGLRDPLVSEALVRGRARLMLVQWTGTSRQTVTLPWVTIDSFASLERFAQAVADDSRVWRNYSTAIGEALLFTAAQFDPVVGCARQIIDLSGDGTSNEGILPIEARAYLKARGITVNALAIEQSEPELTAYFFENVIRGEGAFVVTAARFSDYPEKIRKKLLREITQQTVQVDPVDNAAMQHIRLSRN